MTEPSQYFKGRTVQEQMNEVIGYVDARAEEVAAAKADDVLEPAEQAKDNAIAAKEAAEDAQDAAEAARDTTLAALPAVNTRIDGVVSDLNAVTLRVTTAEGNIVTIQGRVTAVETKNSQQDTAIAALRTADAQNVKINRINDYALGLTGSQEFSGVKKATATGFFRKKSAELNLANPGISGSSATDETFVLEDKNGVTAVQMFNSYTPEAQTIFQIASKYVFDDNGTIKITNGLLWLAVYSDRVRLYLRFIDKNGNSHMKEITSVSETD